MPWPTESVVAVRERLVLSALGGGESFAAICRRFRVARSTGYKWLRRYRERGRSGLADRSRRPLCPSGALRRRWLPAVRQLRRRHPS
jgi:transposase-like protein